MRRPWAFVLIVLLMLSVLVNISLAYDMARPDHRDIDLIGGRDESANVDDKAAVSIGVEVHSYENHSENPPYYGHDGLMFRVFAASNVRKGIEYEYSIISSLDGYWYAPTEQLLTCSTRENSANNSPTKKNDTKYKIRSRF
jgi:hypothetical protein